MLSRWSEVAYFRRWYANKPLETRASIKGLVQAGRLEFVLGGWSAIAPEMSHFEDLLTTFEQSQRWLLEEFGYRCVVAYVAPQTFMSKQMKTISTGRKMEKRKASFQMVIDDVYAISKGRLVGKPK